MLLKVCGVYPYQEVVKDKEFIYKIVGVSIYGFGIITCMTISCLYHALAKNNGKRVFRVIDHDFVFVLVASTYTIFCLGSIREEYAERVSSLFRLDYCCFSMGFSSFRNNYEFNKY